MSISFDSKAAPRWARVARTFCEQNDIAAWNKTNLPFCSPSGLRIVPTREFSRMPFCASSIISSNLDLSILALSELAGGQARALNPLVAAITIIANQYPNQETIPRAVQTSGNGISSIVGSSHWIASTP
ncbi:hypothetical protein EMEDMD4_1060012 [Sinorhizobium medicae]|uniref:Uncharacterized protein n=1 Tax=Sinorhizobium medicae TaxID=110321 RepID=A0A508WPD3_9HYPH|nr:hypothetical protein EMEDMD4_1060012 [Sinorhizobium medicae]